MRTSGGRSGRGRPRRAGWNLGELGGRTALSDMAVGVLTVVQLCLQYDTRQEYNSEQERACDATHRNSETDPRAIAGYRAAGCAPRTSGKQVTGTKKKPRLPHPLALPVAGCPRTSHSLRAARRSAISAYPTVLRGLRPPTRTVNDRRPTCGPNHRTNAPVTVSRSTAAPPTVAPNCRDANMNAAPPCLQPPHLHRGANGGRRCMASVY